MLGSGIFEDSTPFKSSTPMGKEEEDRSHPLTPLQLVLSDLRRGGSECSS